MTTTITVVRSNLRPGWELAYAFGDGPAACAPECEAVVYATRAEAEHAAASEREAAHAWDRAGMADAPHMDAF